MDRSKVDAETSYLYLLHLYLRQSDLCQPQNFLNPNNRAFRVCQGWLGQLFVGS